MIKTAILATISAATMANGATAAAASIHETVQKIANIYTIAGDVMNQSFTNDRSAEANLYMAAAQLDLNAPSTITIADF